MIPSERPNAGSAANAWLSVSDDLLWGFNHALSNRLAAITSIARILEYSDTGLDPLLSALSSEIATLEETLKLFRLMPRDPLAQPEPVLLEDVVPESVRLHGFRSDAAELEFETVFAGESQPVWIQPGRMAHAILIALAAVSRDAIAAGRRDVQVRVTSTDDLVTIAVSSPARPARDPDGGTELDCEAIGRLVADAGGECGRLEESGVFGLEIRLPTLVAVRARERGEASSAL